jgi:GntR family transcriptional regulator
MKTRPKYLSIADEIHARILGGEFAGAGKLPTQKELAQEYGVAVLTVKQALSELQNEGLISGVRGSGTFISSEAFRYQIKFLSSFADEVSSQQNWRGT